MARDISDQSLLSPTRVTRSQSRHQPRDDAAALDESFNMKLSTSDTFLLDSNASFMADMLGSNTLAESTMAAVEPPSPTRSAGGSRSPRRIPSPVRPKPLKFVFNRPQAREVFSQETVAESSEAFTVLSEDTTEDASASGPQSVKTAKDTIPANLPTKSAPLDFVVPLNRAEQQETSTSSSSVDDATTSGQQAVETPEALPTSLSQPERIPQPKRQLIFPSNYARRGASLHRKQPSASTFAEPTTSSIAETGAETPSPSAPLPQPTVEEVSTPEQVVAPITAGNTVPTPTTDDIPVATEPAATPIVPPAKSMMFPSARIRVSRQKSGQPLQQQLPSEPAVLPTPVSAIPESVPASTQSAQGLDTPVADAPPIADESNHVPPSEEQSDAAPAPVSTREIAEEVPPQQSTLPPPSRVRFQKTKADVPVRQEAQPAVDQQPERKILKFPGAKAQDALKAKVKAKTVTPPHPRAASPPPPASQSTPDTTSPSLAPSPVALRQESGAPASAVDLPSADLTSHSIASPVAVSEPSTMLEPSVIAPSLPDPQLATSTGSDGKDNSVRVVVPPPRVAAHVPKPMRVVSTSKRSRTDMNDENTQPTSGKKAPEEETKLVAKRAKVEPQPKPKSKPAAVPGKIGRGHPSASRKISGERRHYTAPTTSSSGRVPLGDRGQQRAASLKVVEKPCPTHATTPHAFTFESDRRLDIKKAKQQLHEKTIHEKAALPAFKPAHHPATLDRPTAASLSRAVEAMEHAQQHHAKVAPTPKPSTLTSKFKTAPTVPHPLKFATDERLKERNAFDEMLRQKGEERHAREAEEKAEEERRQEEEVKQLRKLMEANARANVHEVPGWYKERRQPQKETGA